MLLQIFTHGQEVSFLEIYLFAWAFNLFKDWSDEMIWLKKSLHISFKIFWITNALWKSHEETNILIKYFCSLFKLIFNFLKAGKVSLELHLEIFQTSRIFLETFSPILPICIGWSQLIQVGSIGCDLNFYSDGLGAVALESLEIAVQDDS